MELKLGQKKLTPLLQNTEVSQVESSVPYKRILMLLDIVDLQVYFDLVDIHKL